MLDHIILYYVLEYIYPLLVPLPPLPSPPVWGSEMMHRPSGGYM